MGRMPTIFKTEVGDMIRALRFAGKDRGPDWHDALDALEIALGFIEPINGALPGRSAQTIEHRESHASTSMAK